MTLEELQVMGASHERQLQLISEQLELIRDLARIHDGQIRELSAAARSHNEQIVSLRVTAQSHDEQIVELREIVGEIGVMLKNFIASMQGGIKNGGAS